jgi:hypothetical protein
MVEGFMRSPEIKTWITGFNAQTIGGIAPDFSIVVFVVG